MKRTLRCRDNLGGMKMTLRLQAVVIALLGEVEAEA